MKNVQRNILIGALIGALALVVLWRVVPRSASNVSDGTRPGDSTTASSTEETEMNPHIAPQAGAVITEMRGEVIVTREKTSQPARLNMELRSEDVIDVPKDGSLTIIWPYYGKTILDSGTSVKLPIVFETTRRDRFIVQMELLSGRVWTRLAQYLDPSSGFEVIADTTIVQSRGLSFGVEKTGSLVRVLSTEGSLQLFSSKDSKQGVTVSSRETSEQKLGATTLDSNVSIMTMEDREDPFVVLGDREYPMSVIEVAPTNL